MIVKAKTKFASLGNLTSEAPTMAEAKAKLKVRIEDAVSGDYRPRIISSRGCSVIVWRKPTGWCWSWVTCNNHARNGEATESNGRDFYEEHSSALLCLARATWDGSEQYPECLSDIVRFSALGRGDNLGKRLLEEFRSWREFQIKNREAQQ